MDNMTEKQERLVDKIINELGRDYLQNYFKDIDLDNLTKTEAQKIIEKFNFVTRNINRVYGRDFHILA